MKYDLHMHTKYSLPCGHMEPAAMLKVAKKIGLSGIAVADHNTVRGGLVARKLNRDRDFEVIVAEEVKTQYGDVLLLYASEEIKSPDLLEVLDAARKQGCIVVIPHAFRGRDILPRKGFRYPLEKIRRSIDALEAVNGRNAFWMNRFAARKADELGLAKVAGSDAHYAFEVGRAYTVFNGDLRQAIKQKKTEAYGTTLFGLIGAARRISESLFE